jgi:hypothetical protein
LENKSKTGILSFKKGLKDGTKATPSLADAHTFKEVFTNSTTGPDRTKSHGRGRIEEMKIGAINKKFSETNFTKFWILVTIVAGGTALLT